MARIDFGYLATALQSTSTAREAIRAATGVVEDALLAPNSILNRIHTITSAATPELLATIDVSPVQAALSELAHSIPQNQFHRYHDSFSKSLQSAAFVVLLKAFLLSGDLLSLEAVAVELGISPEWTDFPLALEDYLHAVISITNELSRLAVNRVIKGDYQAPLSYSIFVKEVALGFGLLNLKNGALRVRYDSIKYEVKRLEEIVYDLSLRGLLPDSAAVPAKDQGPTKRARNE